LVAKLRGAPGLTGVMPYVAAYCLAVAVLFLLPELALWLPSFMGLR